MRDAQGSLAIALYYYLCGEETSSGDNHRLYVELSRAADIFDSSVKHNRSHLASDCLANGEHEAKSTLPNQ